MSSTVIICTILWIFLLDLTTLHILLLIIFVQIIPDSISQWRTQEFFSEGVQQIQLRTEDREDGDLGAVAP